MVGSASTRRRRPASATSAGAGARGAPQGPTDHGPQLFTARCRRSDLTAAYPELAAVCDEIGFGDTMTIGEWSGAPEWALLRLARDAHAPPPAPAVDCSMAEIPELIDDIVRHHHRPLRNELRRLSVLVAEAVLYHPEAEQHAVAGAFRRFEDHVMAHLRDEEQVVFPAMCRIEAASRGHAVAPLYADGMTTRIRSMVAGHDCLTLELMELRDAVGALQAGMQEPDLRLIHEGLDAMTADFVVHDAKEFEFLVPAAIFSEEQVLSRQGS